MNKLSLIKIIKKHIEAEREESTFLLILSSPDVSCACACYIVRRYSSTFVVASVLVVSS